MKQLILAVLLLAAAAAFGATFTATQAGDWNTGATWGNAGNNVCHSGIPCMTDAYSGGPSNGDKAVLAGYAVTCTGTNEVCSTGASSSTLVSCTNGTAGLTNLVNSGGLTIGPTAKFVYADPVCFKYGTITLQNNGSSAAKVYQDDSWALSPAGYQWADNSSTNMALWAVGTAGHPEYPYVLWEGDSYASPLKYSSSATCNAALVTACMAGAIGLSTGSLSESGQGTFYNFQIQNVYGTTNNGSKLALSVYVVNSNATSYNNLKLLNSGYLRVNGSGNKNISFNGLFVGGTYSTSTSNGCFYNTGSGTGTHTLKNAVFECPVSFNSTGTATWSASNVVCNAGEWGAFYTAGTSNLTACASNTNAEAWDQAFFYIDPWALTTTPNGSATATLPVASVKNSVFFEAKNTSTHTNAIKMPYASQPTGTWYSYDNVFGGLGDTQTASTEGHQEGLSASGSIGSATTIAPVGNIMLCGYQGRSSITFPWMSWTGTVTNLTSTVTQNTACTSAYRANSTTGGDAAMAEVGTLPGGIGANLAATVFFRADGTGSGFVPEIYDATSHSAYVTTPPWAYMQYNAVLNADSGEATTAPCGTYASNCSWITTGQGPTSTTEIMFANQFPAIVDPARSVPLFSEYLDASGLWPVANYQTGQSIFFNGTQLTTAWKGAWTTSTGYSVGDVVSSADTWSTTTRTTYWICKEAHTSDSTNRPVSGADSSNPFAGPTRYWELAWLDMWMKPQVYAGTTYVDGAVPSLYSSTTMYAVGLLNAWLRQGFITTDPRLWAGHWDSNTYGCSTDHGSTWVECGAMPLKNIQHLPPPMMVN